jgi:hypothetical protein
VYVLGALMAVNTALLFVLINVAFYFIPALKNGGLDAPNAASFGDSLSRVYPGLTSAEINALLQETWSLGLMYQPFTMFREPPHAGTYVNVSTAGFRKSLNQGPWPPDPRQFNVFVFGGSTTFGYGVPDSDTVSSHLGKQLAEAGARQVSVYNFGRGSYYSSQERILFAELLQSGFVPDAAVFVDGLNDFFFDKPDHSELIERVLGGSSNLLPLIVQKVPVVKAFVAQRTLHSLSEQETPPSGEVVDAAIARYLANKAVTERLASAYGIRTLFVWQPVPTYEYDLAQHPFAKGGFGRNGYPRAGYPKMAEAVRANRLGENFVWCADIQRGLAEPLYVDKVHYSGRLSALLATCISRPLSRTVG